MSVIGLDLGTSRVKAVRFDGDWQAADSQVETTLVQRAADGRSVQDMAQVWLAAARVLGAVAARSPDTVELVAITAQGDGCWLVGADGEPVGPAMLWEDSRAASIVDGWARDGVLDAAFRRTGCYGQPGLANAQLRWLEEHDAGTLSRAARLLSCGSWVYQRLTGREVLDRSEAANPFLPARRTEYDAELLDLYGLADRRSLLPPVVSGPDRVAPLTAEVAQSVGIAAGTPVAIAPYDVVASCVGVGVVGVGTAVAILGTTLCVGQVCDDPRLDRTPGDMSLPTPVDDRWLVASATLSGTGVLDWAAALLGRSHASLVVELAAEADLSSDLPLLVPYLSPAGERSPFRDSAIRGRLVNLTIRHTQTDIARATLDGLTLVVRDCLAVVGTPDSLTLCGGGSRSELWCQAICDAVGVPVDCADTDEVGARGAALVGATDAGWFSSLDEASAKVIHPRHRHDPDPAAKPRYDAAYELLLSTRGANTDH